MLREFQDLFNQNRNLKHGLLIFRTPWESCLSRVYGRGFTDLIENLPHILGSFLGSVARIYRALADDETNVVNFSRSAYINLPETSYGYGYIESARSIFPEFKSSEALLAAM